MCRSCKAMVRPSWVSCGDWLILISLLQVAPRTPQRGRILQGHAPDSEVHISIRTTPNVLTKMSVTVTPSKPRGKQTSDSDDGSPTPTSRRPQPITPTLHKSPHRPRDITPMLSPSRVPSSQRQTPNPSTAQHSDHIASSFGGEPPVIDNTLVVLDGPEPVYPREVGATHLEDPLPMIPRHPKKYYNIYRGLKIGVFYDTWYVSGVHFVPF